MSGYKIESLQEEERARYSDGTTKEGGENDVPFVHCFSFFVTKREWQMRAGSFIYSAAVFLHDQRRISSDIVDFVAKHDNNGPKNSKIAFILQSKPCVTW